jgi:hypothetical protein
VIAPAVDVFFLAHQNALYGGLIFASQSRTAPTRADFRDRLQRPESRQSALTLTSR